MSYESFQQYLERLKKDHDTKIHWPVIDIESVEAKDHSRLAALQLADIGVSAIAAAAEPDVFGNVEASYALELLPNIYNRAGNYLSYGVKLLPSVNEHTSLPHQAKIIEIFGGSGQSPGS